jgi:hypothetical protein
MLERRVRGEDRVVRLDNGSGDLKTSSKHGFFMFFAENIIQLFHVTKQGR